jgi:hypothetical protein
MAIHILVPLKYMTTNLFIHLMDLIFPHYEHLKKIKFYPSIFSFFNATLSFIYFPHFCCYIFLVNYTFEESQKGVSGQYQPQKVGR